MTLEILISTLGLGIERAVYIPVEPIEGVSYLIVWQYAHIAPDLPCNLLPSNRDDVNIIVSDTIGLSMSRNIAFQHATGDILLLADDDVVYKADDLKRIMAHYEADPTLDIATFQAVDYEGKLLRKYANHSFTYDKRPRGTYFCSFEISMRRSTRLPWFDLRFGLGAPHMCCGEEEVFLHQAHINGLNIRYIPEVIVKTDSVTTGGEFLTNVSVRHAKGGVLCFMHGSLSAKLRCLKHALCDPSITDKRGAIRDMWDGVRLAQRATTPAYQYEKPLVSIVIPYRNRAERFRETLESIARIYYRPLEIILVDNGSTDHAPQEAEAFRKAYVTFASKGFDVVFLNEPREGAAIARNTGAKAARGRYLYFFDSDDTFSPDFVNDAVEKAEREKADIVMAYTAIELPDGHREERRYLKRIDAAGQIITGQIATQSLFFRADYFRECLKTGWNEALSKWDDWELGLRIAMSRANIAYLTHKSYHIIPQHPDSITGPSITQTYEAICKAYDAVAKIVATDRKLSFALALHKSITAGTLRREGNAEKAKFMLASALSHAHACAGRTWCRMLAAYVAHKGRGAWRLAILLIRVAE